MKRLLLFLLVLAAFALMASFARAQAPATLTDGTNGTVAAKPARTQPALVDIAHVVALSPNNGGIPVNLLVQVQKRASISSGSVASLALAYTSNVVQGNSLIVSFCNGNTNAPTAPITDTLTSTWTKAVHIVNGSAFECDIWYAVGISGGANTITVTPGGSNASIAMEIYEYSGMIQQVAPQADVTTSNSGSSATASATAVAPMAPNSVMLSAVGVGTAAQTITVGTGWTNDSGQQNPTTPAGLFSFVGMSQQLDDEQAIQPSATFTSEPWVIAAAVFHSPILPVGGVFRITDGTSFAGVISGTTALKTDLSSVAGTATVNGGLAGSISVGGTVATNVAITDNPINLGAQGVSSENSAVTTGRKAQLVSDLVGKLITLPYANPENFVNGTTAAITDTTSTSTIASAGGSLRNYITQCTVTNSHATVGTFVKVLDGSTIIWETYAAAAGGGASASFPAPLRGTAATAVNCQPVTTGANVICSCSGYKGL